MKVISFVIISIMLIPIVARKSREWDSKFEVPSGFRSYQAQRDTGRAPSIDDMAYGFEGFLDEGIEADVVAPAAPHEHHAPPHHHAAHVPVTHHHHHQGHHAHHRRHAVHSN
eukprot:c990_g1_i1.p1 GENE.c990_g1_i1~~c990_g1_i1.p1  ORF type:complete len:127 (+),score=21.75 c990_g1_i1:47-382(+)